MTPLALTLLLLAGVGLANACLLVFVASNTRQLRQVVALAAEAAELAAEAAAEAARRAAPPGPTLGGASWRA